MTFDLHSKNKARIFLLVDLPEFFSDLGSGGGGGGGDQWTGHFQSFFFFFLLLFFNIFRKTVKLLTHSLPYISAHNMPGKIRLILFYHCVTYNFIQNHNHFRDLHQIFSYLFETFGTMSEIMFSNDSMSKKYFFLTAENT